MEFCSLNAEMLVGHPAHEPSGVTDVSTMRSVHQRGSRGTPDLTQGIRLVTERRGCAAAIAYHLKRRAVQQWFWGRKLIRVYGNV